jgi:branched-subunit amino acid transport protein
MTSYDPGVVWLIVIAGGLGTFALKASFVMVVGRVDEIPPVVERTLRFVPAAVLAALVLPSIVALDTPTAEGVLALPSVSYSPKLPAAAVAGVVAWKTQNVLATIAVGMAALWILQAL